jgi:hypothetical protein
VLNFAEEDSDNEVISILTDIIEGWFTISHFTYRKIHFVSYADLYLFHAEIRVMKWGFDGKSVEGYTVISKEKNIEASPSIKKKRRSGGLGSAPKRLRVGSPVPPPSQKEAVYESPASVPAVVSALCPSSTSKDKGNKSYCRGDSDGGDSRRGGAR